MASGSVIHYEGKRGRVFRIKYRDAAGRQVMETLGAAEDGWNERKAQRELRNRMTDVERDGYRRLEALSFAAFAAGWQRDYLPGRNLKPSTTIDYENTIRRHLLPFFGEFDLASITPADVDAYIAAKTGALSRRRSETTWARWASCSRWRSAGVSSARTRSPKLIARASSRPRCRS